MLIFDLLTVTLLLFLNFQKCSVSPKHIPPFFFFFLGFLQVRQFGQCLLSQFPNKPPVNPTDIVLFVNPTQKGLISHLCNHISKIEGPSFVAIRILGKWTKMKRSLDTIPAFYSPRHFSSLRDRQAFLQFKSYVVSTCLKPKFAGIYTNMDPILRKVMRCYECVLFRKTNVFPCAAMHIFSPFLLLKTNKETFETRQMSAM